MCLRRHFGQSHTDISRFLASALASCLGIVAGGNLGMENWDASICEIIMV